MKNKITRKNLTLLILAVLILLISVMSAIATRAPRAGEGELRVIFFNVGNGDCALLQYSGKNVLIDTGNTDSYHILKGKLHRLGIKTVHALIVSHFDSDHSGNAASISQDYGCDILYTPKPDTDEIISPVYRELKNSFSDVTGLFSGDRVELFGLDMYVLSPSERERNDNSSSLVIKLEFGPHSFLFTGDAQCGDETKMVMRYGDFLNSDVLKVSHHGSGDATGEEFLSAVSPKYAVISVGENYYGHPGASVVEGLNKADIILHITMTDNDAVFVTNGDKMKYKKCRL